MPPKNILTHHGNGAPQQKRPNGVIVSSRLETLPEKAHLTLFSYLTFREATLCLAVSKDLRTAILLKEGWGYILSNENSRYQLSDILPRYRSIVRGKRVYSLELTANHQLSPEERSEATNELQKLMIVLADHICYSIKKAIFEIYCISDKHWLSQFADIASGSLTYLTIQASIAPTEIPRAVQYILNHFHKLRQLSFGTHYFSRTSKYLRSKGQEAIEAPGATAVDPSNWIYATPAWGKKNMSITSLKVECNVSARYLGAIVFRSMPNLRHLSCRGDLLAMVSEEDVYHNLISQCSSLEFISIEQSCSSRFQHQVATNIFTQKTKTGEREFRVIGRGTGCIRTEQYIKALLKMTYNTLCRIQIGSPNCEYLFFMGGWEFPLLETFNARCNARTSSRLQCIGHRDLCGVYLLKRFQNLLEVELTAMQVNRLALDALESLTSLKRLVLDNCLGPLEEDLVNFKHQFQGTLIVK